MALSIQLSNQLEEKLNEEARVRQMEPQQLAAELLMRALHDAEDAIPSISEIVRQIQALPKEENFVTFPTGSLADALRDAPADPSFDLEAWKAEWKKAEKELEQLNLPEQ